MSDITTEVWTYLGQRRGGKGKTYHMYLDGNGEERFFDKTLNSQFGSLVGGQFEFQVRRQNDGISVLGEGKKFLGLHPDNNKRLQWTVEHRTEIAAAKNQKWAKQEAKEALSALEPLRDLYRQSLPDARRALLATILEYVTR